MSFLHFEVYTKVLWLYSIGVGCFMVSFIYINIYSLFCIPVYLQCVTKSTNTSVPFVRGLWSLLLKLGYLNVICMFILLSNLVPPFCDGFHSAHFFLFYKLSLFIHIFFIYLFHPKNIHFTVSTGSFCVKENILKISHLHTCVFINVVRNGYLLLSIVPFIETLDLRKFSKY